MLRARIRQCSMDCRDMQSLAACLRSWVLQAPASPLFSTLSQVRREKKEKKQVLLLNGVVHEVPEAAIELQNPTTLTVLQAVLHHKLRLACGDCRQIGEECHSHRRILVNGKKKGLSYGAAVRRTRVLHFPHRSSLDLLAAELCV